MKKFKLIKEKLKKIKLLGFTLVELLAVIVILAIIMLIAIPAVLDVLTITKKKAFIQYVDKVVGLSEQKYLEGVTLGGSSSTCIIYDIKTDLDLNNTGNYKGYVLVAPYDETDYQYWVLLYDNDFFLDAIEYKEFEKNALSKLENLPSKKTALDMNYFASTLKDKGVECSSFEYKGGSLEPSNNEPGTNEGTDCEGQKIYNTVPKSATGLYKLIAEKAYMDNVKSEYVDYCDGIKVTKPSKGWYYDYDTNKSIEIENGNGIGVYEVASTKNNKYPIYYYRGEIDNNYVIFANKCWRIVKTTSTGGIKIVYSGNTCDATGADLGIAKQTYDSGYLNITSNLYMHGAVTPRDSKKISNGTEYLYGNNFTYSNGEYALVDTVSLPYESGMGSQLSTHHYTCLNTTGKCTTIYWVYNVYGEGLDYYILNNGKSFDDAFNEMINDTSVSSSIKQTVDKWYEDNLISYGSYIEDTPYCENKTLTEPFNAKTTKIDKYGDFRLSYGPDFNNGSCKKANAYTVSSSIGNGALRYPIAILNVDDLYYAGEEKGYSFMDSPASWVMNPQLYILTPLDWGGRGAFLNSTKFWDGGGFEYCGGDSAGCSNSVRPAISLKSGTDVSGGTGTQSDPYIIR
jgi:prepilin-type N-terminal cleavage/methylation domain-containing protein